MAEDAGMGVMLKVFKGGPLDGIDLDTEDGLKRYNEIQCKPNGDGVLLWHEYDEHSRFIKTEVIKPVEIPPDAIKFHALRHIRSGVDQLELVDGTVLDTLNWGLEESTAWKMDFSIEYGPNGEMLFFKNEQWYLWV